MSKADIIRDTAISLVGSPYVLGNEALYNEGYEPSSHPKATDCSGLVFTCYRKAAVPWKTGSTWPRLTADSYWKASTKIAKPERIGDCAYFLGASGNAYHVALYIGGGETIEARGRKWGVVRYKVDDPVNGVAKRKCVWGRFPWADLGEAAKETVWDWIDRVILRPRDSEMSGEMIRQACDAYGLKPLWVLTITGAETSCGRRSDGRIVTEAHNYGCIRHPVDRTTKWGELALPEPLVMKDGRKFAKYKDAWTGMAALGRRLKVGPSSDPGLYLRQMKVRDWHGFALTWFGKDVPGVAAYEKNLLAIEAGFKAMAKKAGFQW
jgi:hypothetical protein